MSVRSLVIGILIGVGLCVWPAYCREQRATAESRRLGLAIDSAKASVAPLVDTLRIYVPIAAAAKAESDRLAQLVQLVGPSTVAIRETPTSTPVLFEVPPSVVAKMRADSVTIAAQAAVIVRQQGVIDGQAGVIALQDTKIATLEAIKVPACQVKCGVLIGAGTLVAVRLLVGLLF